ncbi:MAG TPA: hypothetical protein VFG83_08690 [Kofleriaceae bacterium]|nr:hypothetical protein [Kofleriaceae bacterium]
MLVGAVLPLIWATPALAQDVDVEAAGYKVGEGTVVHPTVGVTTGITSNVFREDEEPLLSPVLNLLASLSIASAPIERTDAGAPGVAQSAMDFSAGVDLHYREYLSSHEAARKQRDLGIGARLHLVAFPQGKVSFGIDDAFVRYIQPTNFESASDLDRDINKVRAHLALMPGGGALALKLRYENTIDFFENDGSEFANRVQHLFGLRVDWRFLPITRFYFDGSIGIFGPLGSSDLGGTAFKQTSNPLRLILGADTKITAATTVNFYGGFGKGFYAVGDDFTGPLIGLKLGYRYSPFGRVQIGYDYNFQDSVAANFFTDHKFFLTLDQQVKRVVLKVGLDARLRHYGSVPMQLGGGPERDDFIFSALAGANYLVRDWLAITFDYRFVTDQTDFRYMFGGAADDPSYVLHQAMIGVRAAL